MKIRQGEGGRCFSEARSDRQSVRKAMQSLKQKYNPLVYLEAFAIIKISFLNIIY
jgi:hypothetical protein